MKKLDKKQIPQFIALCVITAGLAGYVVMHLVAPSPVSAGTRAASATPAGTTAAAKPGDPAKPADAKPGDATVATAGTGDAPPPSPAMHDPFAVGYVDPKSLPAAAPVASALPAAPALPKLPAPGKQVADTHGFGAMPISFPGAPTLPAGLSGFPGHAGSAAPSLPAAPTATALPTAPAAPLWTVTGVLQGETGKVAILRSGEARRIVHSGDFVDSTYRVTGVTRNSVILRHGDVYYHLVLGGTKAAPALPGSAGAAPQTLPVSAPMPLTAPVSMPISLPQMPAVLGSAIIPVYHLPQPKSTIVHLLRQGPGLKLASEIISVPRIANARKVSTAKKASPAKVAGAISLGLRLLDGSVLADDRKGQ